MDAFRGVIILIVLLLAFSVASEAEDMIVYTAHQTWPSRIYLLGTDGSVIRYFEYDFTRFCDVEVVDNELYVSDAFAPRAFRVDLDTGDLDLIIDDWSLYYFYDLGFDGTYFYVTEWDLNRYDRDGSFQGRTSFDRDVFGSAWDGSYYWILTDNAEIECWDLSGWPSLTEITDLGFLPPTPECRGLWFDGTHFWTAESKDGLGQIYKFDYGGEIVESWLQPAFSGWAAGMIIDPLNRVDSDVADRGDAIARLSVHPNPLRTETTVVFDLPIASDVTMRLFDLMGSEVVSPVFRRMAAGRHEIVCSTRDLKSGVYFVRLTTVDGTATKKVIVAN